MVGMRFGIKKTVRNAFVPLRPLRVSACAMARAITLMRTTETTVNATVKKNDAVNWVSARAST